MTELSKNRQGPDATQVMMLKNDVIKEKHKRSLQRLKQDRQRTTENLEEQIKELRVEIRDMRAYTVVYKNNSLKVKDELRSRNPLSHQKFFNIMTSDMTLPYTKPRDESHKRANAHMRAVASTKKFGSRSRSRARSSDPFRVRSCLVDVEMDSEETDVKPQAMSEADRVGTMLSINRRLKRSKTAPVSRRNRDSLLPGNCTSYYSARKYYEQEKDKLLKWYSPEEKRKRTIQWLLESSKTSPESLTHRTVNSAVKRQQSEGESGHETLMLPKLVPSKVDQQRHVIGSQ